MLIILISLVSRRSLYQSKNPFPIKNEISLPVFLYFQRPIDYGGDKEVKNEKLNFLMNTQENFDVFRNMASILNCRLCCVCVCVSLSSTVASARKYKNFTTFDRTLASSSSSTIQT